MGGRVNLKSPREPSASPTAAVRRLGDWAELRSGTAISAKAFSNRGRTDGGNLNPISSRECESGDGLVAGRVNFMRGYAYVSFPRPSGWLRVYVYVRLHAVAYFSRWRAGAAGNGKIEIGNRHLRSVGVGVGVARASTRALIVGLEKRKEVRIQERQAATGRTTGWTGSGSFGASFP